MAIFNSIPSPQRKDLFEGVMDQYMKQREMAQNAPLKAAQAQKEQMIANLISQVMGNGQSASVNPEGASTGGTQPGMPSNAANNSPQSSSGGGLPGITQTSLAMGLLGIPEDPTAKRAAEMRSQAGGKVLQQTAENTMSNIPIGASIDALEGLMQHPSYEKIAGTAEGKLINAQPLGIPLGGSLQRLFPGKFSKEDAELAGTANAYLGNITTAVAAKFKGPFKGMINSLINTIKPNMGDSLPVQRGKLKALKAIDQYGDAQSQLIAQYVNQGMDPTAAMLKASKEIPFSAIKNAAGSAFSAASDENKKTESGPQSETATTRASNEDQLEGQEPPPGTSYWIRPDNVKTIVHDSQEPEAIRLKYKKVP